MVKSILDIDVSQYKDYFDPVPVRTVNLLQWLQDVRYQKQVERIRGFVDKAARDKIKATLPCITVSGTFRNRCNTGLLQHSGLICIDIDYKDNQHIENYGDLKHILSTAPFVAYCGMSVSGTGYFIIIPLKYPEKHEQQFEALHRMYERAGVVIDTSCRDVTRLRGYSWDSEAYINHKASPFDKIYEEPEPVKPALKFTRYKASSTRDNRAWVEKYINEVMTKGIDITDNYKNWVQVGFSLSSEFGEGGRQYFHDVSRCYPEYSYDDADRKYTSLLKSNAGKINIGTFFHLCKEHGINLAGAGSKKAFKFH